MTTEVKTKKAIYDEAIKSGLYNAQASGVAETVLDVFNTTALAGEYSETLKQIEEASKNGDVTQILALSKKLGSIKDNRANHEKALNDYKQKFKFPDILQAYAEEFSEMKYQAAIDALKATHIAVEQAGKAKGKRGPNKPVEDAEGKETRPAAVYKITKDGKSVEFVLRAGPAKLDPDQAAFEFLGFKLVDSADGKKKVLEPAELVFDNGQKVKAARASIVKALEAGGIKMFADYDIAEIKPTV